MDARDEASKKAEAQNAAATKQQLDNTGSGCTGAAALTRKQNEPDTEVSDERCKELRKKSVDKMKKSWGETDVMKKKKKKTAEADKESDNVDVSGIAKVLSRGPGSAYEV